MKALVTSARVDDKGDWSKLMGLTAVPDGKGGFAYQPFEYSTDRAVAQQVNAEVVSHGPIVTDLETYQNQYKKIQVASAELVGSFPAEVTFGKAGKAWELVTA